MSGLGLIAKTVCEQTMYIVLTSRLFEGHSSDPRGSEQSGCRSKSTRTVLAICLHTPRDVAEKKGA